MPLNMVFSMLYILIKFGLNALELRLNFISFDEYKLGPILLYIDGEDFS